jgi:putative methyltransferase (TIGR04325 family)
VIGDVAGTVAALRSFSSACRDDLVPAKAVMDPILKPLLKTAALNLPFARDKVLWRDFLRTTPSCLGVFPSFAAAKAAAPAAELPGYDDLSIAEVYQKRMDQFKAADYPVLFWMDKLLPQTRVIFELGGSVGRAFYPYSRYLDFAPGLRWIVCDLSSMVKLGIEIARERNVSQLTFTTERETEQNPDIYATFGTLQYIEEPFATIIAALRARPPHILVNRVPMTEGPGFITLQNNGSWFSPYKIDNRSVFIASIVELGYELGDEWEMDRPNIFLSQKRDEPKPAYCGMYFRLKSSQPS